MIRLLAALALLLSALPADAEPPNVVLAVTDDQGYGDLGCHGNPVLKTPHIDRFAARAVECTHFYVSPVCAPTRASLLTGRYHFRTGVVDTFNGRALMRPDEVTLAQLFAAAGYRTGIFGKWHLGDNYPLRPQDRGFHEVLMLRGGGIGQPSDPPGTSYYRPVLEHNGRLETYDRYCTDLFTDRAIQFIESSRNRPFFVYLPYNCPHTPLEAPASETAAYQQADMTSVLKTGPRTLRREQLARLYGMETNIDANFGRLLAKLEELKLADNTIVVYLSDNGPQENRYNAGLRGLKGSVYEGGIRVPFFVRWPAGGVGGGRRVHDACAHIDMLPSLAAACGLGVPKDRAIDGLNLLPRWRGDVAALAERTLFFQWHRGDAPAKFRACAVREPQYKLVQASGERESDSLEPKFELFDTVADPNETNDLSANRSDIVARMKGGYDRWFADVTAAGFAPVRPQLGTRHENPTRLTRQDWRGPRANRGLGHWEVNLPAAGTFDVTATLRQVKADSTAHFRLGSVSAEATLAEGQTTVKFRGLKLPAGDARLEVWVERAGEQTGVWDVEATALSTGLANPSGAVQYRDHVRLLFARTADDRETSITSPAEWAVRRRHILEAMQQVMGPLPRAEKRVPLDPRVVKEIDVDGYRRIELTIAVEANDRLPAFLFVPDKQTRKLPAVLCLHPTNRPLGKGVVSGLGDDPTMAYAVELAKRGYVTLAPDYVNMGDYRFDPYAHGYASATMKGIWNHMRCVDYLASLQEVDAERIGAIGHSLGGHNSMFLGAFDERVKCIISSCGFCSFPRYMNGDLAGWSHDGYMPRIRTAFSCDPAKMPFDFTEVVAALAPRPFLACAPVGDTNFDVQGVRDCIAAAAPVYELLGAKGRLKALYPDAGHEFPPAARQVAYEWLDRWLKPR